MSRNKNERNQEDKQVWKEEGKSKQMRKRLIQHLSHITFFMLAPTKLLASSLNWGSLLKRKQTPQFSYDTIKENALVGKKASQSL